MERLVVLALLLLNFQLLTRGTEAELYDETWINATATWYVAAPGNGNPDGGACGYNKLNDTAFKLYASAGSSALFQRGHGCGACYQVRCTGSKLCSGNPVTVTITDLCPPGGSPNWCGNENHHFDMTTFAYGAMSLPGLEYNLTMTGVIRVTYRRVPCSYPKANIAFAFNKGSNPWWMAISVRDLQGPGQFTSISIQMVNSSIWQPMKFLWGANYYIQSTGPRFIGPYSIQLSSNITDEETNGFSIKDTV